MSYILKTERLLLRKLTTGDSDFIIRLVNTEGWIKYIGDRNIKTHEQALTYLNNGPIKSYHENGFGLWLVELKDDHIPIGICGILKRKELEHADIGFAFLPEFTGNGYALEISKAVLRYTRETFKLETISAITLPNNKNSIRLLEKLGMQFVKELSFPNQEDMLLLYSTLN
ncbi:GNAT family N-acetyltransferase [Chryseosolibacter indicus]|uniref:GNAT family N-acetyltransferase n=1 Tax=Chryseosolibacter indicus TaxID=2782351 RepID=A0ABS5VXN7_9BACT|nr:GNAT family N-acetyltransferase [Chryseosolibacter indicus]MBT1705674.1 GNAT family N-acetyltransferase [Chryseosolibacter indicus]